MKCKHLILCGFITAGLAMTACEKTKNDGQLNEQDETFLLKASEANSAEIAAGNLALAKGANPAVKAFGQHMISEHTTAQADLKTVGNNVGFPVRDSVDAAHMEAAAKLAMMSGRAFDSAYIWAQVSDHQVVVNFFQAEQNNGSNMDVKNFANTNLPHIQMHLMRADSIANAFFKR